MSSPPSYYTDLFPKRGDITGSNDQAFSKGKDVLSHLVKCIRANIIMAIGTLAPGTSIVQYLFAPKIHHHLGGAPKSIVGNASNKLGEFSCVKVPNRPGDRQGPIQASKITQSNDKTIRPLIISICTI